MEVCCDSKQIILGLSGVARSGKDMLCKLASDILIEERNLIVQRYALADELKNDANPFLKEKCGIDIWDCTPEEKERARPFLVWFGGLKRKQTQGRYWVEKLGAIIEKDKMSDVIIITDIRYGEEDVDEVHWLREELKGSLIHISQFTNPHSSLSERIYRQPPNDDEARNDPIMRKHADFRLEWGQFINEDGEPDETLLKPIASDFLNQLDIWN
jgi:hypothetical protein